jgi:hypothetical protein
MNRQATADEMSLSLTDLLALDGACDRFEAALRAGEVAEMASLLALAPRPLRSRLLRELLALELGNRLDRGERPDVVDYHGRFPEHRDVVDAIFARFGPDDPAPDRDGTLGGEGASLGTLAEGVTRPRPAGSRGEISPEVSSSLRAAGYDVLGELGRGGMGIVYLARRIMLNRPCAVKMILGDASADPESSLRFLAEAETVARLHHPHVVQVHHFGQAGGSPFVELEYLPGGSLDRALDGTPWPAAKAAELIESLARAVAEAHRLGIIHRDLKPANVLLTTDGIPKIGDFGLAKSLGSDSTLTRTGLVVGSPCYMSPEQAEPRSNQVGPATDIYGLGAILYELLTGYPPFKGATVLQTLDQVRSQEPVPPRQVLPGVARDLETICLKCLEKDPRRRYQGATALAEDLDRFLHGRTILARPAGAVEHAWKWASRQPAVALLSVALVSITALSIALVSWQWRHARTEAAHADGRAHRSIGVGHDPAPVVPPHPRLVVVGQPDPAQHVDLGGVEPVLVGTPLERLRFEDAQVGDQDVHLRQLADQIAHTVGGGLVGDTRDLPVATRAPDLGHRLLDPPPSQSVNDEVCSLSVQPRRRGEPDPGRRARHQRPLAPQLQVRVGPSRPGGPRWKPLPNRPPTRLLKTDARTTTKPLGLVCPDRPGRGTVSGLRLDFPTNGERSDKSVSSP